MGWVAPVLAGVGALGGLFGNRPQTFKSTNNQQFGTSSTNTGLNVSTPQLDPLAATGYNAISDKYLQLINSDPDLKGFQANASGQINNLADIQRQNSAETLAARGVAGPAAATAANSVEGQRIAQQVQLSNSIPLLARQLMEKTLSEAGGFYRGMPVGNVTQTNQVTGSGGWSSQQGTSQSPGNQLGGLFGGFGDVLALLLGMNNKGGGGGGGNANPPIGSPAYTGGI